MLKKLFKTKLKSLFIAMILLGMLFASQAFGATRVFVPQGGTGVGTFTDAGVLLGNGTDAIQATTAGTSGQVLTSNGVGVDPTFKNTGFSIGDTVTGGTINRGLFINASGDVDDNANYTFIETPGGTASNLFSTTGTVDTNDTGTFHVSTNMLGFGLKGIGVDYETTSNWHSGIYAGDFTGFGLDDKSVIFGTINTGTFAGAQVLTSETQLLATVTDGIDTSTLFMQKDALAISDANTSINGNSIFSINGATTFNANATTENISFRGSVDPNLLIVNTFVDKIGIGLNSPTAFLHIKAGTLADTPLKLTAGMTILSAEAGAFEYDGTQLYFSPANIDRNILVQNESETAFTAGSIPYATTSGYLTEDTTNLVLDTINNRLNVGGIKIADGTEANGYVLTSDANGVGTWQAGVTSNIYTANGTTGAGRVVTITDTLEFAGTVKIVDGTQANGYLLTSDINGLASWTAPVVDTNIYNTDGTTGAGRAVTITDNLNFGTNLLYLDETNGVAHIGATSHAAIPNAKLNITHTTAAQLRTIYDDTHFSEFRTDVGGNLNINAYGGQFVNFDSTALVIDQTNNRVGIGDSTPDYELDVAGDINLDTTSSEYKIAGVRALKMFGSGNLFLDNSGENAIGSQNVFGGSNSFNANILGGNNTGWGWSNQRNTAGGNNNTTGGYLAMGITTSATASQNTCWGASCLEDVIGDYNSTLGFASGQNHGDGDSNTLLGAETDTTAGTEEESVALGRGTIITASNQFVLADELYPITDGYYGEGVTSTSATDYVFHGTGGSGTNNAGGSIGDAGGAGTGTATGGDTYSQTSVPTTTGTTVQTLGDRQRTLAKYTTLTESTATSFARVNVPTSTVAGGTITYTIEANDATDFQALSGVVTWDAVNKAGTTTITITDVQNGTEAVSAGTLTNTVTAVDATGGNVDFKLNAVSSLTQTVLRANAQVVKNFGTGAITAQ